MVLPVKSVALEFPDIQEFLKAGVQFGHEKKRWNPKMAKYIFATKKGIHVIDVSKTIPMLQKAMQFLSQSARQGSVMFVGTKRQVSDIVKEEAVKAGAYFVADRWPGGLLTNLQTIGKSLRKMQKMEEGFENGFEDRTKYEITKMKAEWQRLNRLFGGLKGMQRNPMCLVVIDPRYEIGAVTEARKLGIPIVAITDTNCDPDLIDYVVPANDDALRSVKLIMGLFRQAILSGNGGQGVRHNLKDYTKVEIKVVKKLTEEIKEEKQIESQQPKQKEKFRIKTMQNDVPDKVDRKVDESTDSLAKTKVKESVVKKTAEKEIKEPKKDIVSKPQETDKVELSTRIVNALKKAGMSVDKAKKMSKEALLEIKGLGEKAVDEILQN
jgi:small subunit ribosomal protein S2